MLVRQVDGTAGLPSAPEMPCAPEQLRSVPTPDIRGRYHGKSGTSALQLWRYRSSQTSSMRQLLIMLLTIIVQPFTVGCEQ